MTIALIGPSGSGKGTQASRIVSEFNLLHISTGDLFRQSLEQRTALGLLAKAYMDQGCLVPDEVADALIEEWLLKVAPEQTILFDGFPHTLYQATFLDNLLEENNRQLKAVIYLKVPDEVILARLPGRVICRNCQSPYHLEDDPPATAGVCDNCGGKLYERLDDNPEIVRTRLKVFHRAIKPLVNYYAATGKLIIVDGDGTLDEVTDRLIETVAAIQKQEPPVATKAETAEIQVSGVEIATPVGELIEKSSIDVVLLGAPGSGKGTQAEHLKDQLGLLHIATGDLFRENLNNNTDLGKLAKTYMERGELVPDDVTEAMVEERLSRPDTENGFVLDGFPRTLPQAEALTGMLNKLQRGLDSVLYIKVSDAEIVKRLSGRRICRSCQTPYHLQFKPPAKEGVCDRCDGELYQRADDNEETIKARLRTFHGQTAPLIDYYKNTGLLIEIKGEGDVSEVTARTLAAIQDILEGRRAMWVEVEEETEVSEVEFAEV